MAGRALVGHEKYPFLVGPRIASKRCEVNRIGQASAFAVWMRRGQNH